jgi:hypothetical protein
MACGKRRMTWQEAREIADSEYPQLSTERRKKIAAKIMKGG